MGRACIVCSVHTLSFCIKLFAEFFPTVHLQDERSLDYAIWVNCSFLDEIDLTAIITNEPLKHNLVTNIRPYCQGRGSL